MKKLDEISLLDVLPESVLLDPKLKASAQALDFQIKKVTDDIKQVLHLPRLDELSGLILDYLMEQQHIDFAEPLTLSDEVKRNLIRQSIFDHRIRGTKAAVEKIAKDALRDAQVIEWFDYDGLPYHFKIRSHGFVKTPDGWLTYLRMINAVKSLRSWCDNYELYLDETDFGINRAYAGVVESDIGSIKIQPARPSQNYRSNVFAGNVNLIHGDKIESLRRPKLKFETGGFAGMALQRGGNITIDTANAHSDEGYLTQSHKVKIFAGMSDFVHGHKLWNIAFPRNQSSKIFAANAQIQFGNVEIKPTNKIRSADSAKTFAAQVTGEFGNVKIKSSTLPTTDENFIGIQRTSKVVAGTANYRTGEISIRDSSARRYEWGNVVHVGCLNEFAGEVVIGFSPVLKIPNPDGDSVILSFAFKDGYRRLISIPAPRDNLTKSDVSAVDKGLLVNSKGSIDAGVVEAVVIRDNQAKLLQ